MRLIFPVSRRLRCVFLAGLLAAWFPVVRADTAATSITLTTLHTFQGNGDGSGPFGGLIAPGDGYFYGTTSAGGVLGSGGGGVFRLAPDGTLLLLASFPVAAPYSTLTVGLGGYFYGTGSVGGQGNHGFVFRTAPDGTTRTVANFNGTTTGLTPYAGLVLGSDGSLYGTTTDGGANGSHDGIIFRFTQEGALTVLHTFDANHREGATPYGALVQGRDGDYYGTTFTDGPNGAGTVFRVAALGIFDTVYAFTGGADGANPHAGLLLGSDGNFYGTTIGGGGKFGGTVFQLTPQGVLNTLHVFDPEQGDGIRPAAPLIDGGDGYLYGTTTAGGSGGGGTIFAVSTKGDFHTVYNFTGGADGAQPYGPLAPGGDGIFYGTTSTGGGLNNQGHGTAFRLNLRTPPVAPGSLAFRTGGVAVSESAGSVTLSVNRTEGAAGAVRVGYTTVDGSARAGVDFRALSGTLGWADGDTAPKTLSVPISDLGVSDGSTRSFTVQLLAPTGGAALGTLSTASVTIQEDDMPRPAAVTLTVLGDGTATVGGKNGRVLFSRSGDLTEPLTVAYQLKGKPGNGVDYQLLPGALTIPAGAGSAKLKIKAKPGAPYRGVANIKILPLAPSDQSYLVDPALVKIKFIHP